MSLRDMVQAPKLRSITQGSIFNHAARQDYAGSVLGLLISARCDFAQNKQDRYIYVPMVEATCWIDSYIIPRLFVELRTSIYGAMKEILKQEKHGSASIDVFGPLAAANLLAGTKAHGKYLTKAEELTKVDTMLSVGKFDKTLLSLKAIRSKTDDLINNKIEGFFFLDNVIDYQDSNTSLGAFVAILSEPSLIPRTVAIGIADGLDHEAVFSESHMYRCIAPQAGEMSYVLCNVKSPYIELALQKFSSLYSRIGIEDPSSEIKERIAMEAYK